MGIFVNRRLTLLVLCIIFPCSTFGSEDGEGSCLKNHTQRDAQLTCRDEILADLALQKDKLIEFAASRGDPFENLILSLRDVNKDMRQNYAKMIENVGKNVYPLMIATDGEPDYFGVGGTYKIYFKNGAMKRVIPVSPTYEMFKSLSHIALGLFSILSPYFRNPNSINWLGPLRSFRGNCENVRFLLEKGEAEIPEEDSKLAVTMITATITYIDATIEKKSAEIKAYEDFAKDYAHHIEKSMGKAAKAQAEATIPALQQLKEDMGEEEWKKLYVIIPTVWPVSLINTRLQALEKVMSFDQIKTQILLVEGAKSEAEARTTLGRVLADRAAAQVIWGSLQEDDNMKDHIFSLSTKRDLVSTAAAKELNEVCAKEPTCPFSGRSRKAKSGKFEGFATMLQI